ncbi:MAG: glycosyltransferase family 4 protein, partial [Pseudorhodobacter sp.]|nr:glycosyltransferase family 4 protein [Frankiaceae bacterium]
MPTPGARLLVFEDSIYRRDGDGVWTDQSFLWFAAHLADRFDQVELVGRLDPQRGSSHYLLPRRVRFTPLPHYTSLAQASTLTALLRSTLVLWRTLGRCDVAWVMGPHPLAVLLVLLAPLRGTAVVLGVRQDLPCYARHRHPGHRWTHRAADVLEVMWRRLSRRRAVVAVGPDLARAYGRARRTLQLGISLVGRAELTSTPTCRAYDGCLQMLSVGRLEAEKNPLMLADVLACLRARDPRWRLVVCGEGPLAGALLERLERLGVARHAELRGYLPVDAGLQAAYSESSVLLHVSWTEGVPQVLYEAWAAG